MSFDPYKRYHSRGKEKDRKLSNQELLFGITQKDIFKQELIRLNRLTGNKNSNQSMPKKKNTIVHSNSTNQINKLVKESSNIYNNNNNNNMKENNYNIININVNNLIINNNSKNNNNINKNPGKVFSKIGNDIIDGKGLLNYDVKRNKMKGIKEFNNQKGSNSLPKKPRDKYEPMSNIQGIINNLMEVSNSPPPFDNSLHLNNMPQIKNDLNKSGENIILGNEPNIIINNINTKENKLNMNLEQKVIDVHIKLWEIFIFMEFHADNKIGLGNQLKKLLNLIETEFINNNITGEIFNNGQLNHSYCKIIKIFFVLATYIKFILSDFNFEMTIKSNIKRLLSIINENLLTILYSQVFLKDNLSENNLCSKVTKDFSEIYTKFIKLKKIKRTHKDQLNIFCKNINKNLEILITTIKQFSNNFFKIGFFNPIHTIFIDIFRLIDKYKIFNVSNIIINNILFYYIRGGLNDKSPTPKIVSIGSATNSLADLGFINVPGPYLNKLPPEQESTTYTLVLDLDETLVNVPKGTSNIILRPGLRDFLHSLLPYYELIVFTTGVKEYADQILNFIEIDEKYFSFRLYRQNATCVNENYYKDLNKLGRDIKKIIIVDDKRISIELQEANGIIIKPFIFNPNNPNEDYILFDLVRILIRIAKEKPDDVRESLKNYRYEIYNKISND
jgi:Dullard-like phosphatase family protein